MTFETLERNPDLAKLKADNDRLREELAKVKPQAEQATSLENARKVQAEYDKQHALSKSQSKITNQTAEKIKQSSDHQSYALPEITDAPDLATKAMIEEKNKGRRTLGLRPFASFTDYTYYQRRVEQGAAIAAQASAQPTTVAPNGKMTQYIEQQIAVAKMFLPPYGRQERPENLPTTTIPLNYIVSQGYYIGYDSVYGVVLRKLDGQYKNQPLLLWNKKEPATVAEVKRVYTDVPNTFNNLSPSEYQTILASKPTWDILQAGYNIVTPHRFVIDNIWNRLNFSAASVVL